MRAGGAYFAASCQLIYTNCAAFPPVSPFQTEHGYWGLRADADCDEGTLLCEYVGEVIDVAECVSRLEAKGRGDAGTVDAVYFAALDGDLIIDAERVGGVARFANHSCRPNCVLQKWSVRGETRVVIVSKRPVWQGEELTYNYNSDTLGDLLVRQACLCGAPNCCGAIGGRVEALSEDEWLREATAAPSND